MADKRKAPRRPMWYMARIELGVDEFYSCAITDISNTGACINVDMPELVPDRFVLLLSDNGSARRNCRVVWRRSRQIGVTFERQPSNVELV